VSDIPIDKLIRSRRKTIGFQITNDARLIVRAPFSASENLIHKLIRSKESWIIAKQDYFKQRKNKILIRRFVPGEEYLFLGQSYSLVAVENLPKAVVLDQSLMISRVVLGNARDHIENWYKAKALDYITQKVQYYAQITGLKHESIKVNSATTRWGSCGRKNTLNFTWRLVMAPPRVVDYVIIHELVHLKQKNHSHKFWEEVAKIIPDYKQDERWLKQNGHLLAWDRA
jgi:predicted metal-dependent hydrolase